VRSTAEAPKAILRNLNDPGNSTKDSQLGAGSGNSLGDFRSIIVSLRITKPKSGYLWVKKDEII
jgi:hypothetical protein